MTGKGRGPPALLYPAAPGKAAPPSCSGRAPFCRACLAGRPFCDAGAPRLPFLARPAGALYPGGGRRGAPPVKGGGAPDRLVDPPPPLQALPLPPS